MYTLIQTVHPTLVEGMCYVNMANYALERLNAEQRLDTRLNQISPHQKYE